MNTLVNTIIKDKEKLQEMNFRRNLIITGEMTRALWYSLAISMILHRHT